MEEPIGGVQRSGIETRKSNLLRISTAKKPADFNVKATTQKTKDKRQKTKEVCDPQSSQQYQKTSQCPKHSSHEQRHHSATLR
jgi:hypothetical protein